MPITKAGLLGWGLVVVAAACAVAPIDTVLVERWFSTGIYARVQPLVTTASNRVPFALLDVLAGVAILITLAVLVGGIRRARRGQPLRALVSVATRVGVIVAVAYLWFLILWGFNYRRVPMGERLDVRQGAPTSDAVLALGRRAASELNRLHDAAHRASWRTEPWRSRPLHDAFAHTQRLLSDGPPAEPGRLKPTLIGPYFRWTGVDGMVNPFALEVVANPDLLPFEQPFVAAHEWAHLAGYADESEANFVGWLTCVRADTAAQYSGWLFLYWQVNAEVGQTARASMASALGSGPRRDIEAIADRMRRGQLPTLRRATWAVYDQYLKANRVEEGVRSYGAVVTLLLQTRFDEGWTPRRASRRR